MKNKNRSGVAPVQWLWVVVPLLFALTIGWLLNAIGPTDSAQQRRGGNVTERTAAPSSPGIEIILPVSPLGSNTPSGSSSFE